MFVAGFPPLELERERQAGCLLPLLLLPRLAFTWGSPLTGTLLRTSDKSQQFGSEPGQNSQTTLYFIFAPAALSLSLPSGLFSR